MQLKVNEVAAKGRRQQWLDFIVEDKVQIAMAGNCRCVLLSSLLFWSVLAQYWIQPLIVCQY